MPGSRYSYHRRRHSHPPHHSNIQLMWMLHIFSSTECNAENAALEVMHENTIVWWELRDGYGWLYTSPRVGVTEHDDIRIEGDQFINLIGRYRTPNGGFWVIFLDGMRWYNGSLVDMTEVTLSTDDNQDAPHFINSDGDDLGRRVTLSGRIVLPLFSFVPRNKRPVVYIKEDGDAIMVIPNSRMMMWVAGNPESPPLEYWNMLRGYAATISIFTPVDSSADAEVPQSIRQIAQEIGSVY
ncbi:hypothetical protein F4776DRAFT_651101 [Hypoxylon sp. NC0597]|nr:hypothetical protein F4776DRAFT_651101 [Hypoxylon sp. NC0597]